MTSEKNNAAFVSIDLESKTLKERPRMEPPRQVRAIFACIWLVFSVVYVTAVKPWLDRSVCDYLGLHLSESQMRISIGRDLVSSLFLALYIAGIYKKKSRLFHVVVPMGICIVGMAIGVGGLLGMAGLGEVVTILVGLPINLFFIYISAVIYDRIMAM